MEVGKIPLYDNDTITGHKFIWKKSKSLPENLHFARKSSISNLFYNLEFHVVFVLYASPPHFHQLRDTDKEATLMRAVVENELEQDLDSQVSSKV